MKQKTKVAENADAQDRNWWIRQRPAREGEIGEWESHWVRPLSVGSFIVSGEWERRLTRSEADQVATLANQHRCRRLGEVKALIRRLRDDDKISPEDRPIWLRVFEVIFGKNGPPIPRDGRNTDRTAELKRRGEIVSLEDLNRLHTGKREPRTVGEIQMMERHRTDIALRDSLAQDLGHDRAERAPESPPDQDHSPIPWRRS